MSSTGRNLVDTKEIRGSLPSAFGSDQNSKKKVPTEELQKVIRLILSKSQMKRFGPLYQALTACKPIAATDHLHKLSPFLNNWHLMQIRGRLPHAGVMTWKHPIMKKVIEHAHETNYYEETVYVCSVLQQNNWILGLQNALRNVKLKYVNCRTQQAGGFQHFMADLSKERWKERVLSFARNEVEYSGPLK